MARRSAKTASEQGAHWHHVLVYSPFFQQKPASRLFVFYFWQPLRWEWWRSAVFPLVYLSLGLLLFKCENAGNFLASDMWVYRKSLGRPIPRHSFCPLSLPVANAIPCLYCQNILFQFSALRLPNSCHRQLDSVDVAKASLPAHYPTPCHAPSLPGPSRHKLIGLNPVINRLEKQLSMFASPHTPPKKARLFGHNSPLSFPVLKFCQHTTALCPVLPSFLVSHARERLTSLDTLAVAQVGNYSTGGLERLLELQMPPVMLVYQPVPSTTFLTRVYWTNIGYSWLSALFLFLVNAPLHSR